jgi:hypothetical protein
MPPPPKLPVIPPEVKRELLKNPDGKEEMQQFLEGQWLDADVRDLACDMLGL